MRSYRFHIYENPISIQDRKICAVYSRDLPTPVTIMISKTNKRCCLCRCFLLQAMYLYLPRHQFVIVIFLGGTGPPSHHPRSPSFSLWLGPPTHLLYQWHAFCLYFVDRSSALLFVSQGEFRLNFSFN